MDAVPTNSVMGNLAAFWERLLSVGATLLRNVKLLRREKNLRLCETLSLGDRRFLAIVQFEGRRFLIGATNQSISLLDRLDSAPAPAHKRDSHSEPFSFHGVH